MAMHMRYNFGTSPCLPPANQQREMAKFRVAWRIESQRLIF